MSLHQKHHTLRFNVWAIPDASCPRPAPLGVGRPARGARRGCAGKKPRRAFALLPVATILDLNRYTNIIRNYKSCDCKNNTIDIFKKMARQRGDLENRMSKEYLHSVPPARYKFNFRKLQAHKLHSLIYHSSRYSKEEIHVQMFQ